MNISLNQFVVWFSTFFLLVCFQINFFYNYLFVKGIFPKIPGLGYPLFGHILFIILFYLFILFIKRFSDSRVFIFIYAPFLIYCFLFSLFNLMYFNYAGDFGAFNESIVFLIYFLAFMFCFSFYYQIPYKIFLVFLFLMSIVFLFELDFSKIIPFSFDNIAGTNEGHINYQLVSFFILITWFMCFFKINNIFSKVFLSLLITLLLLFSGGRSELIGFIFSGFVVFLIYFYISDDVFISKFVIFLSAFFGVFGFVVYFLIKYSFLFENSRHTQIFDFKNSSSWVEREYLYRENVAKIIESPLIGDYGSHRQFGDGAYIHNVLSAWQQFGFLGFLFYLLLIFIPLIMVFYYIFKDKNKYNIYPYLFISIYVVVLCILTKPIFWPYAGISLGMLYAYRRRRSEQ